MIVNATDRDPIAIVGIGCRLPGGVKHPTDLIRMLREKRSGIVDVPPDRWDAAAFHHPDFTKPGRIHVGRGGFIDEIDRFDPGFFGLAPHEAARMDPQQRLVLESVYRAIEDAGARLDEIEGRRIAVIVGVSSYDYGLIQTSPFNRELIGQATMPGLSLSIIANRVSYLFDLRGPSFSIDTACSSALTSAHLACRAIWNGEADGAFVGGVSLLLRPEFTMGFSKGNYLSPDGECRAFSDDANGYVRSEGCGVLYLKRLADAHEDGDRVYALIRGGWINQDGRTSGMTLPSVEAQIGLLESAYRDAGVNPREVVYVEAHGTGTPAGDPIEAKAIGEVIGRGRDLRNACRIGSIKSNIGHLESGAGVAGIIKLALTLWTRTIFPNCNFRNPNPEIPFEELHLRVPVDSEPLGDGSLFGGVNGFGFGGANAHLVLESAPGSAEREIAATEPARCKVFLLSAHSKPALKAMASELAEAVESRRIDPADLELALAAHRTRFPRRLAVYAEDRDDLIGALLHFGRTGDGTGATLLGRAEKGNATGVGYIFSGQGSQWWGMGRRLLDENAIYRGVVEEIDRELNRLGWLRDEGGTLLGELTKPEEASRVSETRIAQPAIFALQMGLAAILEDWGVLPDRVLGHSIGEVAAAVSAGCLTLAEGTRIVYHRSLSQAIAEGRGLMAAIGVSESKCLELLAESRGWIELAAINGPSTVTVAGLSEKVHGLVDRCEREGIFARLLNVSVPFHSFLMDPIEEAFRTGLGRVAPKTGRVPFFSSVIGGLVDGASLGIDYWWNNIRRPVRFETAYGAMLDAGGRCFVEIGPHPILKRDMGEAAAMRGRAVDIVPTLNRKEADDLSLARAIQELWTKGLTFVRRSRSRGFAASLPQYPFQRESFWNESCQSREHRVFANRSIHPHIATFRSKSVSNEQFTAELSWDQHANSYLSEHVVQGVVVVPAAAQLDVALSAALHHRKTTSAAVSKNTHNSRSEPVDIVLEDLEFRRAIALSDDADGTVFELDVSSDRGDFQIASRARDDASNWTMHTRGRFNLIDGHRPSIVPPVFEDLRRRINRDIPVAHLYQTLDRMGLSLSPGFRGIVQFSTSDRESIAQIKLDSRWAAESHRFLFHPCILDSVIQSGVCGMFRDGDLIDALKLPHRLGRIEFYNSPGVEEFWCYATIKRKTHTEFSCDLRAFTFDHIPLVVIEDLVMRQVPGAVPPGGHDWESLFQPGWNPFTTHGESSVTAESPQNKTWLVLTDGSTCALVDGIIQRLASKGVTAFLRQGDVATEWRPSRLGSSRMQYDVARETPRFDCVLDLRSCDAEPSPESVATALSLGPDRVCRVVQELDLVERWSGEKPRVIFVTRAAQILKTDDPAHANSIAATVIGFGRTLISERPHWCVRLIDLSATPTEVDLDALLLEMMEGDDSREVAIRDGSRQVSTVRPQERLTVVRATDTDANRLSLGCDLVGPGGQSPLAWTERPSLELSPREVEIDVHACGVNFKDVALCLGLLDQTVFDKGYTGRQIGMECAGTIRRVGSEVRRLQPGEEVFAIAAAAIANRVVTKDDLVVRKPSVMSFDEAAGIPLVFATVTIALTRLARLEAGETVLIHAGAGGVGLAAIQLAHHLGAKVITTVGSPRKVDYLKGLGVEHIFNSRRTNFREMVLATTGGRGVDVVLNSLAGRSMLQSLRCLAPYGRFVEIGKTDIMSNRQIPMQQFSANQTYFGLDVDQWLKDRGPIVHEILNECVAMFEAGAIRPLPVTVFAAEEVNQAINYLAEARQIGKVVVTAPQAGTIRAVPRPLTRIDGDGWYIITGGTRGYGLEAAAWLARHGARRLALISRAGRVAEEDRDRVEALRRAGATVEALSCDVGDLAAVERICSKLRSTAPLHGFVHAATVLDDAPIGSLNADRIATVMRPKAVGAWNLIAALKNDELRLCLFFSSISSVFGTPGQANYAAANAYLDSMAKSLRSKGAPAFIVNWGVLDEVGIVGRASPEQRRKILAQGCVPFRRHDFHRLLDLIIGSNFDAIIAASFDWASEKSASIRERFPEIHADNGPRRDSQGESLIQKIQSAAIEARENMLARAIFDHMAELVGFSSLEADLDLRLDRLGVDSLTAMQLGAWTEQTLGVPTSVVQIMRGPTSRELARKILQKLGNPSGMNRDRIRQFPIIHCLRSAPRSRARLICLPDVLGDSSLFEPWSELIPQGLEIYCVNVFATKVGDSTFTLPIRTLLESIAFQLRPLLDRPYLIYGHSAGAWIGVELDRIAKKWGWRRPECLACGAMPTTATMMALISRHFDEPNQIPNAEVRSFFTKFNVPNIFADNPEMIEVAKSRLWLGARTDFQKIELPTDIPVLLFGGDDDLVPTVDKCPPTIEGLMAPIECRKVPGDHMFVKSNIGCDAVVRELVARFKVCPEVLADEIRTDYGQ